MATRGPSGGAGPSSGGRPTVDGRRVRYGVVGAGRPALFLHGWGLRPNAYARPIEAMAAAGCRVVAPCLPGFGGTQELHPDERTFPGYGAWVERFCDAVGLDDLALVAGHSMGGGVSTAFVHHRPDRVGSLLLANAIGGPTWALFPNEVRTMVQRPFWDWGRHFAKDLLQSPRDLRMLPTLLEDFIPNLVRNPLGMVRTGEFIRRADLVAEVAEIAARPIPVTVAWSDRDGLVPRLGLRRPAARRRRRGCRRRGAPRLADRRTCGLRGAGHQRAGRRSGGRGSVRRRAHPPGVVRPDGPAREPAATPLRRARG